MFDNKTTTQTQAATISRINNQGLEAQRKLLLDHLQSGNTINFMQAMDLGITHLNTRIAELRSRDIHVYSRPMAYRNIKCQEYSLQPFLKQQPPSFTS